MPLQPARFPLGGGGIDETASRDATVEMERRLERLLQGGQRSLFSSHSEASLRTTWDRVNTRPWQAGWEPRQRPELLGEVRAQLGEMQRKRAARRSTRQ